MQPPIYVHSIWDKFSTFPMETLTKMWVYHAQVNKPKQRPVTQMKEDRERFGVTGNCYDLSIWLLDAFEKEGITAYPIGHDLGTDDAHVGVMAVDEDGNRYLCDLGDQWLSPILINEGKNYTSDKLSGFFPAADIQVFPNKDQVEILYHRPNGKVSRQHYETKPVEMDFFLKAAEICQNSIHPKPLLECRLPYKKEIAHWEFYNWNSFLSTTEGIIEDPALLALEDWVERIYGKTGFDREFLFDVLGRYERLEKEGY